MVAIGLDSRKKGETPDADLRRNIYVLLGRCSSADSKRAFVPLAELPDDYADPLYNLICVIFLPSLLSSSCPRAKFNLAMWHQNRFILKQTLERLFFAKQH